MTIFERVEHAAQFFDKLFGKICEPKFSYTCVIKQGVGVTDIFPFDVSTPDNRHRMAQMAIELNDQGLNVYFGVNCSDSPATLHNRGKADSVTVQTCIVCDIDIATGNHKSGKKKKLAKDFDEAKSFLPFATSTNNHSGGGLHGYCILETPIAITDQNRKSIQDRNVKFINAIRQKAGKDFQIDGVADLSRVLRVPGTYNFKGGVKDDAPLCYVVEENPVRFTYEDFDSRLDGAFLSHEEKELKPIVKKIHAEKKSARTASDSIFDSPDYDIFRAEKMLESLKSVNHEDLSYGRWLAIQTACKNIGVPYDVVDAFNSAPGNGDNYDAKANWKRWQMLNAPSFGISALHGIARDLAGYREADARKEYRRLFPEKFKAIAKDNFFSDEEFKNYFDGDLSDLDNAKRLEHFIGSDVRYKFASDDDIAEYWLLFQNGKWTRASDKPSCLLPAAYNLQCLLSKNAIDKDSAQIANCFKQTAKAFNAICFLRACESIKITTDDLDKHSNLLNCLNGVVDLQTGKFYPHDDSTKNFLLTQQVRAAFNPDVDTSFVDNFFRDIQPNEISRAGLLRWLGYCATAETCEEKFMLLQGCGSNGKSVLGATLLELFGDYGTGLNQRALLRNGSFANDASRASTELNCLEKRRFAISEELPQKADLNVELVKNLTGGDRVPIRHLYHEESTIENFAKINISGNFAPAIENINDEGLKRRILKMPFTVKFGNGGLPIDYDLKRKMKTPENLSALLLILVREALAWYDEHSKGKTGLIISDEMQQATAQLLDENNFVAEFIDDGEKYIRVPNASVKVKDFIDDLKLAFPAECSKFKRNDLIRYVESVGGVEYTFGRSNCRVFKGIGKLGNDFDDGEPVATDDVPPPTADDAP